jgi:hypothetical protein
LDLGQSEKYLKSLGMVNDIATKKIAETNCRGFSWPGCLIEREPHIMHSPEEGGCLL